MRRGVTIGVWDLLHHGHVRFINRARAQCDELYVGICSDALTEHTKGRPVINESHRAEVVAALRAVSRVFIYRSLWVGGEIRDAGASRFFIGPEYGDHQEHQDVLDFCADRKIEVIQIPRTEGISTTLLREAASEPRH